ncbi:MAG: glucose-6-phosphate isomerase, partial [Xanthobacteraceae bacterium]|nr:glucose-6-phosphate isomerase [Xanthobacteraceae bacterium]
MGTLPFVQDVSRAFAGNIARGRFEENLQRLVPALASLRDAYEKKTLAHLRLPERTEDLAAIKALAEKLRGATDVVFLGTGGSSLGGQTLAQLGGYNVPGVG